MTHSVNYIKVDKTIGMFHESGLFQIEPIWLKNSVDAKFLGQLIKNDFYSNAALLNGLMVYEWKQLNFQKETYYQWLFYELTNEINVLVIQVVDPCIWVKIDIFLP